MKKLLALVLATATILAGCGGSTTTTNPANPGTPESSSGIKMAKEFNKVYSAELTTFNYLKSSLSGTTELTYLTVDGLVEFDKYGVMQPALATEWSMSEDGLTYTFKLREGVKWYTYDGQEYADVTAHDFVTAMKWVLTADNAASASNLIYGVIAGAKDYFDGKSTDFSTVGIKAINDYTLEYKLERPTPYFTKMVSYICWLPVNEKFLNESGDKFGTSNDEILYNGAYFISEFEPENLRTLKMNENYWGKDNIHIEQINYQYNKEASAIGPELFLRGEIDEITLPVEIVLEWQNDPAKKDLMHRRPMTSYSYYYGFNFEPSYEAEYKPEDWTTAVNNLNFRKSLYHGVDRVSALMTLDPFNPEGRVNNTITIPNFANVNGIDYTQLPALKEISDSDSYNTNLALDYKTKAMAELEGKVTFPIKVVMPYNTGSNNLTNRVQVVEQQLERLLGTDYIDVVLVPYPSTNYNAAARSSGKFSMLEINWGPDYADPESYTDTMSATTSIGDKYSKPFLAKDYLDESGVSQYMKLLEAAKAENLDIEKRYQLFSEAEAFLLNEALVLPFYVSGSDFTASLFDPFSGNCSQFGRNANNLKGKVVLEKSMNMEEFAAAEAKYNAERSAALKAAANK